MKKALVYVIGFFLLSACGQPVVSLTATPIPAIPTTTQTKVVPSPTKDQRELPPTIQDDLLSASKSAFCTSAAAERPDALMPAPDITVPQGYKAEYFVPPSGVNVPSDVVVMPNGDILVASSRAGEVQKIGRDGTVSVYSQVNVYSLDTDSAGNLYGYNFPDGSVFKIQSNGEARSIARVRGTACESTMTVAPDGTIFIGANHCGGQSAGAFIYKIPAGGGSPTPLLDMGKESIRALDVDSSGILFAVLEQALETVDVNTGDRHQVMRLPEWVSFHGLAVAEDGTAYVSSGDFETSGPLYRIPTSGQAEKIASIVDNGLEGLAVTPEGEVIGVQRAIGGVQAVSPDGKVQALVEPNGLVSPQTLAFSPCGELLAVNDESARLTLAYPNGRNISFTRIISFQPPQTFVAFSAQGWYVTGESAPGFPSLVNRYQPNDSKETLAEDIEWVSGVAVAPDNSIYVSATKDGRIFHILSDGTRETLAEGLKYPEGLALSADGVLYAVTGGEGFSDVFPIPGTGDGVISISADGQVTELARLQDAAGIAIGPDGLLYVAAGNSVYRLNVAGKAEVFASGFQAARGVAFDIAGSLYVSDDNGNDIVRISGTNGGEVHGHVLDFSSGTPIAGAFVRVTRDSPPYMGQLAMTTNDGTFSIPALAGEYTVTGWAEGYQVTSFSIADIEQEVRVELLPK